MAITDLTNTTWVVPTGWSETPQMQYLISGELSIGDTDYILPKNTQFIVNNNVIVIGHSSWDDNVVIYTSQGFTVFFAEITPVVGFTIEQLISFLEANGELQGGDVPTDAVTIEYNNAVIATLTEGMVTLPCKDKRMRTNLVITMPEFGGEDVPEWDGSYTVSGGVELISFTIDGDHYEAEEGMTWQEWVDSSYNTVGAEYHVAEGIPCVSIGPSSSGIRVMAVCDINSNVVPIANAIIADYTYTLVEKMHSGGAN